MMLWALLAAPAWAWTCTEASYIWANEPLKSQAISRLRSGWTYTPDELKCLVAAGVPQSSVDQLRTVIGEPFALKIPGELHTVVLDLGCGTLRVTGAPNAELTMTGFTAELGMPPYEVIEGIATIRRNKGEPGTRCADVDVTVPAAARLLIYHRGAHVHVSGMAEAVEITAAEADVVVLGATKLVEIDALRGNVLVDITGSVEVEAGEGTVLIAAGDGATVRSTTVTGDQFIWGGPLRRLDASSVQGDIRSQAALQPSAVVDARSNSGNVLVGVSDVQAALMPIHNIPGTPPSLFEGGNKGASMRPDRALPDGSRSMLPCFDCLPTEVHDVWLTEAPKRLSLTSGARVAVVGPEHGHEVRVHAESLTGVSATPVLDRPPAMATGHILQALDAQAASSLGACRSDLSIPPTPGQVDLWAHLSFRDQRVQSVGFNVDGFDPRVLQCVKTAMGKWTVPDAHPVEVDWPLKLLVVRSPPP